MFDTVLVADRGVLARRVLRTCRRLGARTVTVHSSADRAAPHAVEADESMRIGGPDPATSYLDGRKVLEAAGQGAAQAIHPGGGALATSAAFAASVVDAGLVWVGPSVGVLETLANRSRASAQEGDRRLVVHVLGQADGSVVPIADLERRDGIVECPAPGLSAPERAGLHATAVRAGAALGLVGPAAVELSLDAAGQATMVGAAAGLHLESPVVELVTGVDLVEQQLLLACGTPTTYDASEPRGVALQVELRAAAPGVVGSWQPSTGTGVRVEVGYGEGERTTPYDDLLATVAVLGADRESARELLRAARAACVVDGVELRGPA